MKYPIKKSDVSKFFIPSFGLIAAALTILIFSLTDWDAQVQELFYLHNEQKWLWDRNEPISKFLLYDGFKAGLIVLACLLFLRLIFEGKHNGQWLKRNHASMALLILVLTPLSVSTLKAITNVPCPKDTVAFGGSLPHIDVLGSWPDGQRPSRQQRCFPAGHASGAFGLMGIIILINKRKMKALIAAIVISLGWFTGIYKMAIGDHFLSHTFVSMWIAVFWYGIIKNYAEN